MKKVFSGFLVIVSLTIASFLGAQEYDDSVPIDLVGGIKSAEICQALDGSLIPGAETIYDLRCKFKDGKIRYVVLEDVNNACSSKYSAKYYNNGNASDTVVLVEEYPKDINGFLCASMNPYGDPDEKNNPVRGFVRQISKFGFHVHPTTKKRSLDPGVAFACQKGQKVYAAYSGKVHQSHFHKKTGNAITIIHADNVFSFYENLEKSLVKKGSEVKQGQVIGICGTSGEFQGRLLHFGIGIGGYLFNPAHVIKE